jgi:hypothetical protein
VPPQGFNSFFDSGSKHPPSRRRSEKLCLAPAQELEAGAVEAAAQESIAVL